MIDAFSYSEQQIGWTLLIVGLMMVVNQLFMIHMFASRFKEAKSLRLGLGLMSFGLLAATFSSGVYTLLASYYIMSIGIAMGFSTFSALLTKKAPTEQQGEVLGVMF